MKQMIYAAYHKDSYTVKKSSSGGMFGALSDYILSTGGTIISGAYNYDNHNMEHTICFTYEERDRCHGSKYMQSYIDKSIYYSVEKCLASGKKVLYVSLPCQIAAMKQYLRIKKIDCSTLYTCDILCHGVGSPGIWHSFITSLERKKNTVISHLTFKDKRNGWKNPLCIGSDGTNEYSLRKYSWLYFSNNILRPACHCCRYSCITREGDITIGDFWKAEVKRPDFYNKAGTSFIMVNTENGQSLFEKINMDINFIEIDLEECMQTNMRRPTAAGKYRQKVIDDYMRMEPYKMFGKWFIILAIDRLKERFMH